MACAVNAAAATWGSASTIASMDAGSTFIVTIATAAAEAVGVVQLLSKQAGTKFYVSTRIRVNGGMGQPGMAGYDTGSAAVEGSITHSMADEKRSWKLLDERQKRAFRCET
jgi:hypothetical protein